jgi:hypothetical protein
MRVQDDSRDIGQGVARQSLTKKGVHHLAWLSSCCEPQAELRGHEDSTLHQCRASSVWRERPDSLETRRQYCGRVTKAPCLCRPHTRQPSSSRGRGTAHDAGRPPPKAPQTLPAASTRLQPRNTALLSQQHHHHRLQNSSRRTLFRYLNEPVAGRSCRHEPALRPNLSLPAAARPQQDTGQASVARPQHLEI